MRLLTTDEQNFQVARSGLRAAGGGAEPTHLAPFTAAASEFRLAPGANELRVPLSWTDGQGVTVTKTYVFRPGSYAIEILYDVDNRSASEPAPPGESPQPGSTSTVAAHSASATGDASLVMFELSSTAG